ncbi:hypothetical protein Ga0100231_019730 [Opitutaceae bacterium TAV4]|nr:hypothetical protein Ga0100231_019730 [Opitutaceae bacterium TAV4]RRK00301.1 hypothetical protein Ga0100230_020490 [Opitutaceae bacterium TAV3]
MTRTELKRETTQILKNLPEESEWEDLMYSIYVRKKVDAGLRDSTAGRVFSSQQIRRSLKLVQ